MSFGPQARHFAAIRVEWCKARARALRWSEEVLLLQEEMRRVLQFLTTQAQWWEEQGTREWPLASQPNLLAALEGRRAYAYQQASLRRSIHAHFTHMWRYVAQYIDLGDGLVIPPEAEHANDDEM
jgi:hypothetical protein